MHLNINGLQQKIDQLRCIAKNSNATIIGITKTQVNITVFDSDITVKGYNMFLNERNIMA